jgi:hypothetical protein
MAFPEVKGGGSGAVLCKGTVLKGIILSKF